HAGDDNEIRLRAMNPFARGGYSLNFLTTNFVFAASQGFNTNSPTGTNANGTKFYETDIHAWSFIVEHDQGVANNLAGSAMIVSDGRAYPFYICQNQSGFSLTNGNLAYVGFDG